MIFAPDDKRVVENTAVHTDGTVNFGIHDGGGADDHAVGQVVVSQLSATVHVRRR